MPSAEILIAAAIAEPLSKRPAGWAVIRRLAGEGGVPGSRSWLTLGSTRHGCSKQSAQLPRRAGLLRNSSAWRTSSCLPGTSSDIQCEGQAKSRRSTKAGFPGSGLRQISQLDTVKLPAIRCQGAIRELHRTRFDCQSRQHRPESVDVWRCELLETECNTSTLLSCQSGKGLPSGASDMSLAGSPSGPTE